MKERGRATYAHEERTVHSISKYKNRTLHKAKKKKNQNFLGTFNGVFMGKIWYHDAYDDGITVI